VTSAETWAARLASGEPIPERVGVVVAHPDDETLWSGSLLPRLENGLLIHITDGAPDDMEDAHRLGFQTRSSYARTRENEIRTALRVLGADVARRSYRIRDKCAAEDLHALHLRLMRDLKGADLVISHPYEGGHPDHDAAAWAVAAACRGLGRQAPSKLEFACYHELEGERVFGRFWPGPPEHERPIAGPERTRLAEAVAAHGTQVDVIGDWVPTRELWRAAPEYDFGAPPAPDRALYDRFGWEMTSTRFCALARVAEADLAPC